jgi:hypothetical protein
MEIAREASESDRSKEMERFIEKPEDVGLRYVGRVDPGIGRFRSWGV